MAEEKKIPEIGLAEFVSTLIRETFDAILTSQEEQSVKLAQIHALADSAPEDVATEFLTSEEIDLGMKRFFPLSEDPYCSVFVGAKYDPEPNEEPAVYNLTGYKILDGDVAGGKFTVQGFNAIKSQVMLMLAAEKLHQIRQMIRNGIPRIQVDNGKILAKVSFAVKENEVEGVNPETTVEPKTTRKLPATFLKKIDFMSGKTLKSIQLPETRMMVRQADETSNTSSNSTNIYGEVEIHFRSIL